jgi:predicted esterase
MLAAAMLNALSAFVQLPAAAAAPVPQCGPFGDAPATLLSSSAPTCGAYNLGNYKGTLIGPIKDSDNTKRYACVYQPASASVTKKLPLVVWIHPSLANADSVYQSTNLNFYLSSANVSGDPSKPGFILLAIQGRNTTHHYPASDQQGLGWDNWYRQFNPAGDEVVNGVSYKENVDAATIDAFISIEEATNKVDTNRIFLTGWSNGAAMSFIYGLNRPKIAALAVYSAPNPFQALGDPCPQVPVSTTPTDNKHVQVFNTAVATYHVHNDCDIAGICPNGEFLRTELQSLGISIKDQIINSLMLADADCEAACGTDPNGSTIS